MRNECICGGLLLWILSNIRHFNFPHRIIPVESQTCLHSYSTLHWTPQGPGRDHEMILFSNILLFFSFKTLPLESSCVYQSNPPEHVASTSGQSNSFQPEASFNFTVGKKQSDTQESPSEAKILKSADTWWNKKKPYTHPVFGWGVKKHSQSSLLGYYRCQNKSKQQQYVQTEMTSIFLSSPAVTSWSWSSYGAEWYCDITTFLHSDGL